MEDLHENVKAHGHSHSHAHFESLDAVGNLVFPFGPLANTILAIFLITAITQFVIARSPNLSGSALNFLVAFAEGGMLGTIFLQMLPETEFNATTGQCVIGGFLAFVIIDKGMRIASRSPHTHSHSSPPPIEHSHSHNTTVSKTDVKRRVNAAENKETAVSVEKKEEIKEENELNLTPWLNVLADSLHNVTDGVSLALAFRSNAGFSAFLVMCCHEIPHQVGDFALLLNSGTSKSSARRAQLVTACGTLIGGVIGNCMGALGSQVENTITAVTAGVFLYVATVGVLPELLETDSDADLLTLVSQSVILLAGALCGTLTVFLLG